MMYTCTLTTSAGVIPASLSTALMLSSDCLHLRLEAGGNFSSRVLAAHARNVKRVVDEDSITPPGIRLGALRENRFLFSAQRQTGAERDQSHCRDEWFSA